MDKKEKSLEGKPKAAENSSILQQTRTKLNSRKQKEYANENKSQKKNKNKNSIKTKPPTNLICTVDTLSLIHI